MKTNLALRPNVRLLGAAIRGKTVSRPCPAPHPSHTRARGSVYLAVLGAAMIVALIGVSGVLVNRVQYRTAAANEGITQASLLARSAVEMGLHRIGSTAAWRSIYTHDVWTADQPLGDGTISFKLVDTDDGSLSDDSSDSVRVVGRGRFRDAMRMCSVELTMRAEAPGFRVVAESWRQVVEEP